MHTLIPLLIALSGDAHANTSGKTGGSTTGCSSCHGSSASSSTTVAIVAASTVSPGDTVAIDVTVTNTSKKAAGFNASATGGRFTAGSGSKTSSGEITHSSPQSLSSGSYTFSFDWTAPTALGTYTIYAAGNAVNSDRSSSGDAWNKTSVSIKVESPCEDADEDGVANCDGDCDDGNPAAYPGAEEVCDGLDNDCDGDSDEGVTTTYYIDLDGDGFGDAGTTRQGCGASTGYVSNADDCDDLDKNSYPGAEDILDDGIDQDCDGSDASSSGGGGGDTGPTGGGDSGDGSGDGDSGGGSGGGDPVSDADTGKGDCSVVSGSASLTLALAAVLGVWRRRR